MAIDTRDKRDSAIHVSLPWRMRFPVPDGAIGRADRLHSGLHYSGIVAGVITELVCTWSNVITLTARTGPYDLKARTGPITLTARTGPYEYAANTGPIVLTAETD